MCVVMFWLPGTIWSNFERDVMPRMCKGFVLEDDTHAACEFSRSKPGKKARAMHGESKCLWCHPERLRQACRCRTTRGNMTQSLNTFAQHNLDFFFNAMDRLRAEEWAALLLGGGEYCIGNGVNQCVFNTTHWGLPARRHSNCSRCVLCCPCHLYVETVSIGKQTWHDRMQNPTAFL